MIFPSLPTTRLTRSSSRAVRSLNSMMSLKVSAILPASPVQSPGKRAEKSPFLKASKVFKSSFVFSESVLTVWVRIGFPFEVSDSFGRVQTCFVGQFYARRRVWETLQRTQTFHELRGGLFSWGKRRGDVAFIVFILRPRESVNPFLRTRVPAAPVSEARC